jgi:hypothetical protein
MTKKQKEIRKLENRLDKMWHEAVLKAFKGKCWACDAKVKINTHHTTTRRNKWGRWFIPNGVALCPSHHKFSVTCSAHQAPTNLFYRYRFMDLTSWWDILSKQTDRPKGLIDYEAVERHLEGKQDGY